MSNAIERKVPTDAEYAEKVRKGSEAYTLGFQAMAYVWGWQDALGVGARNTGWSLDFGTAYAVYAADSAGKSRMSIPNAFTQWNETGEIKGW